MAWGRRGGHGGLRQDNGSQAARGPGASKSKDDKKEQASDRMLREASADDGTNAYTSSTRTQAHRVRGPNFKSFWVQQHASGVPLSVAEGLEEEALVAAHPPSYTSNHLVNGRLMRLVRLHVKFERIPVA